MSGAAPEVALVCAGDDPRLGERLRAAAWRGVLPTVHARPGDRRAFRLAAAAGAPEPARRRKATGGRPQ